MLSTLGFLICSAKPFLPEIEKTAELTDKGIKLHWWPKMPKIDGWVIERKTGESDICAMVPKGQTFKDSPSVMYGRASYIPELDKGVTLTKFIADDVTEMKSQYPHMKVTRIPDLVTGKGNRLRTYLYDYDPAKDFTHDEVAFGKEGEFFIILAVSSKTAADFKRDSGRFGELVRKYR